MSSWRVDRVKVVLLGRLLLCPRGIWSRNPRNGRDRGIDGLAEVFISENA